MANFAFRIAINKLLPFMFSPPACFLVTKYPDMKYKEVSKKIRGKKEIGIMVLCSCVKVFIRMIVYLLFKFKYYID